MTIKDIRLYNNLSQKQFGELIGVTQAGVYKYEKKDTVLSPEVQSRLCAVFGLRPKKMRISSFDLGV